MVVVQHAPADGAQSRRFGGGNAAAMVVSQKRFGARTHAKTPHDPKKEKVEAPVAELRTEDPSGRNDTTPVTEPKTQ